jgi:hypothetical protein
VKGEEVTLVDAEAFRSELGPEERIMWTGRPDRSVWLAPSDLYLIPFSLFWAGFVFFAVVQTLAGDRNGPRSPADVVFLIPFALVGLYITVGRFVARDIWKRQVRYAVTNQRLLTSTSWRTRRSKQSMRLQDIPSIEVSSRRNGIGTISLGPSSRGAFSGLGQRLSSRSTWAVNPWSGGFIAFVDIPDAENVSRLIERLRREAQPAPPLGTA